jgi:spore coat protein H
MDAANTYFSFSLKTGQGKASLTWIEMSVLTRQGWGRSFVAGLALGWAGLQGATCLEGRGLAGESPEPRAPLPGTNLFVPGPLRLIKVEIVGEELKRLHQDNRRYVRARFQDGDKVLSEVGVHLKGAAGSFRGLEDHPALTVNFDKFVPDQQWEGLEKIHLNNSVQDGSYLTENLCGELFRQAGVPAPRACNARVELNRRDLGVYVLKEGFDKTFLRQYYRNVKGNLYDGGFCRDITETLDKMSGSEAKEQPEVRALVKAAREPNLERRYQKLEELLELDRFVSFCVMEVMTWDWDGYVLKPNNYRLYWDPDRNKITFFPHGMDQMFWESHGPIVPDCNGLLARALLETPKGLQRYRDRMADLTTNVFRLEWMTNRLNEYGQHVRASMAEKDKNWARDYDHQLRRLRDLLVGREASLRKQLKLGKRP